jgi:hypothetical protein
LKHKSNLRKLIFFGQDGWMSIDDVSRYAGALSVPADQV